MQMTSTELHARILRAKSILNSELVKIKTEGSANLSFREIGDRLDMIHEVERIGVRNLGERDSRKITRMLSSLDEIGISEN